MKLSRIFALALAATLWLAGCCMTCDRAAAKWDYRTIPFANDAELNEFTKQGWVVVSYHVDSIESQWILLKRRVR